MLTREEIERKLDELGSQDYNDVEIDGLRGLVRTLLDERLPMSGVYVVFVRENSEPVVGAFATEEKALALVEAIGTDTAEVSFEPVVEIDRDLADAIGTQYDVQL